MTKNVEHRTYIRKYIRKYKKYIYINIVWNTFLANIFNEFIIITILFIYLKYIWNY